MNRIVFEPADKHIKRKNNKELILTQEWSVHVRQTDKQEWLAVTSSSQFKIPEPFISLFYINILWFLMNFDISNRDHPVVLGQIFCPPTAISLKQIIASDLGTSYF